MKQPRLPHLVRSARNPAFEGGKELQAEVGVRVTSIDEGLEE